MINIGEIDYLNVYPIYYFLKKEIKINPELNFLNIVYGTPAYLNGKLEKGEIDVSPSSSFYYIKNYSDLYLFPGLSISSKENVKSIYLFSPVKPGDFIEGETIYVTPETLSSINLLKILLAEKYKKNPNKINFTTMPANDKLELERNIGQKDDNFTIPANGKIFLHIGDNALRLRKYMPSNYYAFDLAGEWFEFTGFPFIFAFFMVRKDAYNKNKKEFSLLYDYLIKSKNNSVSGFNEAAISISGEKRYGFMSREEIMDYWSNCLSFDLGEQGLNGFKLYCELLVKNGFIEKVPELNFIFR